MKHSTPRNFFFSQRVGLSGFILVAVAVALASTATSGVFADQYDEQIKQLQNEAGSLTGKANELNVYGNTLQEAVNALNAQIADLQTKIAANQAEQNELIAQITQAEKDITQRNAALKQNLKQMYIEGDVSNLEKVASSKSISDFVDKQEYRNKIRERIQEVVDTIKDLKAKNEKRKADVELLIKNDENMKAQVAAQQAQQAALLAQTRGEEAAYQQQIAGKKAEISRLQAEQAAANRRNLGGGHVIAGDPGRGGYPNYLHNAPKDFLVDPWGMFNRECVSYTAWKVQQAYGNMPYWGGHGNANQWPSSARADGISTGSTPKARSVAISMAGYYGHAMWVESVNGDGTITVSQYNYAVDGQYSEMRTSASGLIYIYFGG
ncbi:MAG TPA: CHAP domain-containing protein [Candidatus Saccharimonadales bacterium]